MSNPGETKSGKDAVLQAFDRLFDHAAEKLEIACSEADKEQAKQHFIERFSSALDIAADIRLPAIPEELMHEMEAAFVTVSPAQLVGYLAAIPLAQQAQAMLRQVAYRNAEQRLVEHIVSQADDRFGGN